MQSLILSIVNQSIGVKIFKEIPIKPLQNNYGVGKNKYFQHKCFWKLTCTKCWECYRSRTENISLVETKLNNWLLALQQILVLKSESKHILCGYICGCAHNYLSMRGSWNTVNNILQCQLSSNNLNEYAIIHVHDKPDLLMLMERWEFGKEIGKLESTMLYLVDHRIILKYRKYRRYQSRSFNLLNETPCINIHVPIITITGLFVLCRIFSQPPYYLRRLERSSLDGLLPSLGYPTTQWRGMRITYCNPKPVWLTTTQIVSDKKIHVTSTNSTLPLRMSMFFTLPLAAFWLIARPAIP